MTSQSIYLPNLAHPQRRIGHRVFDFSRKVAVMAIVNRTPDSFHDQGRTFGLDAAVEAAAKAVVDGADWVDIGGVRFGPGPEVTELEELDRVLPVVAAVRENSDVVISVDTYRTEVARQAIQAGADVINDTSGLQDSVMAEMIANTSATLIITHSLAVPPRTPLRKPAYQDVVGEVTSFLRERAALAAKLSVSAGRIIIDPGHDLNKNTYHSLELTRRLAEVAALGYPVLVAVSNKDFIGETLNRPQHERLEGTLATISMCILQGARIVRVHNVKAAVAATRMAEAIMGFRPPAIVRHNLV
ncbi:MAG: dihydropteroate synthase [Pseudonocardiaceae bacterium]